MRYAGSIGKGNINLLYNDFRTVEDFDRETQERLGFSTTPTSIKTPKIKKDIIKDMSHLSQTNDEFDLLSLEQQIELVMQPVINPKLSPEALQRHLQDLESSRISSKELGRNTIDNNATPEGNSKIILEEDGGRELNSHEVTSREFENSKYNMSLPPIKESDPFSSNQVIKHWHYHQPVKYNSMKQHSTSVVGISDSYRRFPNETHIDQNKSLFSNVKNRSPPGTLRTESHPGKSQRYINMPGGSPRSGALKNAGLASILQPVEGSANQFNMQIAANPETSSLLEQLNDPKIISTEGIIPSRRVNFLQDASYEANHLLAKGPIRGNMNPFGKNLLEKNQARSQQLLTDSDKRSLNFIGEEDRVFEPELPSGSIPSSKLERIVSEKKGAYYLPVIADKKVSRSPPKRKEFYNRWYVPVKYWNKAKDNNQLEKKHEELKKDSNYYYHNLHNYSLQNNGNPLKGQEGKSDNQLNYESIQEKLKQNVTIRKYKKQLAESHQRIPNFLKSIEENQKS